MSVVVHLLGQPGSAKTTTAHRLAGDFSTRGYVVEVAHEVARTWHRAGENLDEHQRAILDEQERLIGNLLLAEGVDLIIDDGPLLGRIPYAVLHNQSALADDALQYHRQHLLIEGHRHVWVFLHNHVGRPWRSEGREQVTQERAAKVGEMLHALLEQIELPHLLRRGGDDTGYQTLRDIISDTLDGQGIQPRP